MDGPDPRAAAEYSHRQSKVRRPFHGTQISSMWHIVPGPSQSLARNIEGCDFRGAA